jgi:hypothetical protein
MKKYRENEENRDTYYNEQKRNRMSTNVGSKEKPISISVVNDLPEGATTLPTESPAPLITPTPSSLASAAPAEESAVPSNTLEGTPFGGAKLGAYDAMFDGPADLAIARKQQKM